MFASVLLPKISGIVPRSNSISYGYVDVTILEEKLVGQFWDIGLVLIGEFFEGSHSPPPSGCLFGPTIGIKAG